ncbi:MAG: hypothetical protein PHW13_09685 [Methylococcales bacterium]|nr:hypothetical protein [Methylococcales bacterium]
MKIYQNLSRFMLVAKIIKGSEKYTMARKNTKAENALIGILIIVGLPIYFVSKFVENVGWEVVILALLAILVAIVLANYSKKQKRLAYLRSKYDDEKIVQLIFKGHIWQGQTSEQLQDSLGSPVDIDYKLLKTKSKNIWKYHHRGANRYGLRVTLENDIVIGWDKKA